MCSPGSLPPWMTGLRPVGTAQIFGSTFRFSEVEPLGRAGLTDSSLRLSIVLPLDTRSRHETTKGPHNDPMHVSDVIHAYVRMFDYK